MTISEWVLNYPWENQPDCDLDQWARFYQGEARKFLERAVAVEKEGRPVDEFLEYALQCEMAANIVRNKEKELAYCK